MKTITHTHELPFTAKQIYDLVGDIEAYPTFLSWCKAASVNKATATDTEVEGTLTVGSDMFEQELTTRNYLDPYKSMRLTLIDGPLKHFEGKWEFVDLGTACRATYTMEFEFSNKLVGLIAEKSFVKIADSMIEAFEKRAREIYPCASN